MYLTDLALNDFRSYDDVLLHFEPGVVTFVGENGQGKTNLVEAIAYLATFTSHRVVSDTALVRQSCSAGVVRAKVRRGHSETIVEVEIYAGRANRARINRGNVRPAEVLGIIRCVVFAPEDIDLVRDDPAGRRKFLDTLMVQLRPGLAAVKSEYDKVLRQRGALLKTLAKSRRRGMIIDYTSLDIWDQQLARLGAQIIAARAQMIHDLRPFVMDYYTDVSGGRGIARIDYAANIDKRLGRELPDPAQRTDPQVCAQRDLYENELTDTVSVEKKLRELLSTWHDEEIARGVNLVGPHRDDLELTLGSLPAKGFASHGESWSYALALRLGAWELLRRRADDEDDEPILILDDVFAELDTRRRTRLAEIVTQAQQVFVTAAVGDDLPDLGGIRFRVHAGHVVQDSDISTQVENEGTRERFSEQAVTEK
ncbi:DNA replication/repair protein RecF [Trueperella sp. LYQ143]|uniref:DNA replication/repair protein RecF n=1 Tax=Trueperella sp. LYQ143 TaxID=3391059 RepID=UPI003983320E